MQQVDDPPFLSVGTEVSAKYKGAFCEAKVRKVVRNIKCKVAYKQGLGLGTVSDDLVKGVLRAGATVEVKHPDRKEYVEATITKIQDCSQYTVVFDDGDITTLRRTALCLKSGRHFNESETLDQLPLTHPEHFGNPVVGGRRGRRSRHLQDDSSDDEDDEDSKEVMDEKEEHIGKVVCVETTDSKKKDKEKWFPGLVVSPNAQATVKIRVKDEYLVRSFKDGRYYTVPKKEANEFTRELATKPEGAAVQAALEYLDRNTLPPHWDKDALFGLANTSSDCDEEYDSDSSNDEPREEKDHFVAQLYKYMDDRGTPLNKVPSITNKDVDLYRLFRAVQKLGGYNRVTGQNQWKPITQRLGFNPATVSVTNLVKQAYKKFLQPFEEFDRKLGCTMSMTPRTNRSKGRSLVRANSVASPRPEIKELKVPSAAEESENTSESSVDAAKTNRKLSTGSGKVKALVEKIEEKTREEASEVLKQTKQQIVKEEQLKETIPSAVCSTVTTSTAKKEKGVVKKQVNAIEEKKGRKRKDVGPALAADIERMAEKATTEVAVLPDFPVEIGDKLKVYYHEKKVTYEAKVIEISMQQSTPLYLVHYTGWNTRYDEWVPRERIAENLTNNKSKRTKSAGSLKASAQATESSKASTSTSEKSTPATTPVSKPSGSKRGRGRSDSQPTRSTTPSSLASGSSRTKSPAALLAQRRTTRAQPSFLRRTSNNVSDISAQTDTDSDSDEPVVKKPTRSSSATTLTSQQQQLTSGLMKATMKEAATISAASNLQSDAEPEDDEVEGSGTPKGRDYDLNQIRSELKGFKELKSPSPDPELPAQLTTEKASVFDFNVVEESDAKSVAECISKTSTTESRLSSTEVSSETDSLADDDSQSSDKTTTLENMTEKLQQKIKAEKLARAKCLEKYGNTKAVDKRSIRTSGIEKIIKDTLAEKIQETMKAKPPPIIEKMILKKIDKEVDTAAKPAPVLKAAVLDRKNASSPEKRAAVFSSLEKSPTVSPRPERKSETATEKCNIFIKSGQKDSPQSELSKPADPLDINDVKSSSVTSDVYEFKEPEPFEFESRKSSTMANTSPDIDKKPKRAQKSIEPEIKLSSMVAGNSQITKKHKKSPTKDLEKIKQLKSEEKTTLNQDPLLLLPPPSSVKVETTFDVLRKSPSFNLNIGTLPEEGLPTLDLKPIPSVKKQEPMALPLITATTSTAVQKSPVPFISSPFIETGSLEGSKAFDLKTDIENVSTKCEKDADADSPKLELEKVKKILLDLEPPKVEKPSSIADKVLKAITQQKKSEEMCKQPKDEETQPGASVITNTKTCETTTLKTVFPALSEPPKIELPVVLKKDADITLKKPMLNSPEHKLDILESIHPKNNDLSETIQKLECAIQKTSNVDHFDENSSDSTDSESKLVIEDDSGSCETNQTEAVIDFPVHRSIIQDPPAVLPIKTQSLSKDEPYIFAPKFASSIFGGRQEAVLLSEAGVKPIVDILPSLNNELELSLLSDGTGTHLSTTSKIEDALNLQDNQSIHSESINLLLCEETIPGSPTPLKECTESKPNVHPIESDIKPIPMDIECGILAQPTCDIAIAKSTKSEEQTPNSSPRDSISQDDSSEDLKKQLDQENDPTQKKRVRARKNSETDSVSKKRRIAAVSVSRKTNGSDSEDNSDATLSQRSTSSRPPRPCQYNFLVTLDPAASSNQRVSLLKKKIQELRKTYNMIKVELASIDRRRKKLRRREREKKNQQKLTAT